MRAAGSQLAHQPATSIWRLVDALRNTALEFLFPSRCIRCRRTGSLLCSACQSHIPPLPPIRESGSPLVERRATAVYVDAIREAIHRLKYEHEPRLAGPLGWRLAAELARSDWEPTLLTAIPLHPLRLRSRGYNQSALLAQELSILSRIPFSAAAVQRVRDTRPQVGLGALDRQTNVAGAFVAEATLVQRQSIVIIDDVCTTGSTLSECAAALLAEGALRVWALSVAAAHHDDLTVL